HSGFFPCSLSGWLSRAQPRLEVVQEERRTTAPGDELAAGGIASNFARIPCTAVAVGSPATQARFAERGPASPPARPEWRPVTGCACTSIATGIIAAPAETLAPPARCVRRANVS